MDMKYDAIVVGARCAGAATALLLARGGARVLMVDRGAYGTDTLSTHALMRGGVLQLHRWGLLPQIVRAETPAVRSTTFHYTQESVAVEIEPRYGVQALFAPRRHLLDKVLVDAAVASGVTCEYGVHVSDVTRDASNRVNGVELRAPAGQPRRVHADLVIGADGLHSTVAQRVGAAVLRTGRWATGVLYAYWDGLALDGYNWFFQPGLSFGAIPTNGGTCVFAAFPASQFREQVSGNAQEAYHRLLSLGAPSFAEAIRAGRQIEQVRGFGGQVGIIRRCHGLGWALVGDAGYFKDPLTAHGITDGLRDAELLARAVLTGTSDAMAAYEATRNDLSEKLFDVTDAIASFVWNDAELQALHRSLSREMTGEVRAIAALEPLSCPSSLDNERRAV